MLLTLFCAWLAFFDTGGFLHVVPSGQKRVISLNLRTGETKLVTEIDHEPTGFTTEGKRLIYTGSGRLTIYPPPGVRSSGSISTATGAGAMAPVVSPDGETVYVCNRFENSVAFVNSRRKVIAKVPAPREPVTAAVTPDGKSLFVAGHLPEQSSLESHVAAMVRVVDTVARKAETDILLPNGSTGVRGVAISPDGKWVFVTHILARYTVHTTQLEQGWINTNALTVIDVHRRKLHATVLLDDVDNGAANPWAVAVSPDSKTVYVTHSGADELSVIDLPGMLAAIEAHDGDPSNQLSFLYDVRRRIQLPGKGPQALAVDGDAVWVGYRYSNLVTRVGPGEGIKSYPLGAEAEMTEERRGEMMFNDASLCFQRWQSCSSCHPDARADGLNWDLINDGIGNPKNTKSLVNSHRTAPVMWTGVRPDAEYAVRSGLRHIQFSVPVEEEAKAIDAYLKSLKPEPGPNVDMAAVERGQKLFSGEAGCVACHPLPLYTDNQLHDVGTHGKFDFTAGADGQRVRQTRFKTPSLLEAWRTGPYLHDGRYRALREVITDGNHGDRRGTTSHLSKEQIDDLAAFLRSL